jgi:hypothetical protein
MTAENVPQRKPQTDAADASWRDLARRQGVQPVQSLDDMARPDLFDSDEDLEAFLAHVAASRHADLA